MWRCAIFLAALAAAYGQGSTPKAKAEDYPVHAKSGPNEIGAEYMVHSFSSGEQMYLAENYLVVEVAFYPPKGKSLDVETSKFSLRVNGKKPLAAQNPAMAASALRHRDWQAERRAQGGLGLGGINIGMGGQRPQSPFPGGPEPNRLPTPPRAPDGDVNTPQKETVKADELLLKTALPEGKFERPVSGFIYFEWKGKASTIKSLDLVYDEVALKLR